jgi:4'-phosphopantetheinyl transferase
MPLHSIINYNLTTQIYVWKIEETFEDLFDEVALNDLNLIRLNTMKSEQHQRGFLSVRKLLQEAGYSDFDLQYSPEGKPYLKPNSSHIEPVEISISHSHEFSTIIISKQKVGIDLEICKEKVLKIAPKFMNVAHLMNLSETDQIKKATVIWGVKEAIFKIKNEKGISFPDHIFEDNFSLQDKKAKAQLRFNNLIENFQIHFEEIENYILVYAFED